jgi:prevent-host-death family protein
MKTVSVTEAKAQFAKLLERVMAGEKIGITIRGREVARLVPITLEGARPRGRFAGKFVVPNDFDDPLPKWLQGAFAGERPERASTKSKWNKRNRAT